MCVAWIALGGVASAQVVERPSDRPLPLPTPAGPPIRLLPVIPEPLDGPSIASPGTYRVEAFVVVGSSVFDEATFEQLLAPFTGRPLTPFELHAARDRVTELYIEHGYLNSGAFIPDQDVDFGKLVIEVVEGRLESIEVSGLVHYRPDVVEARLALGARIPLSIQDIEERLQMLQQDPRIERVRAQITPGSRRGLARLILEIDESPPFGASAEANNTTPPGIGSFGGRFEARHRNLTGHGDTLSAGYDVTRGLDRLRARYAFPVGRFETLLFMDGSYSRSDIVEGLRGNFDELGIRTRFRSVQIGIEQPLYRTRTHELRMGVAGEWRRSSTLLRFLPIFGGFPFEGTGADSDGDITVSVVRLTVDWLTRLQSQVIALRSTTSLGVDVLGAGGGSPDEHFVSWLGQAQWARRFEAFERLDLETFLRFDVQLTNSGLPALEQFALGGFHSVRGYHENEIVRDNGLSASLEVRIPVWRNAAGRDVVQLAPFVDFGHAFQQRRRSDSDSAETIGSIGLGLRILPTAWSEAEIYWGQAFTDVDAVDDLQDDGVHFRLRVRVP